MSDKAPSTVTCATDFAADVPIPNVEDVVKEQRSTAAASSSARPGKRRHEGDDGDASRTANPDDPSDGKEAGREKTQNVKLEEHVHAGAYCICELLATSDC